MDRRGFLRVLGLGAAAVALPDELLELARPRKTYVFMPDKPLIHRATSTSIEQLNAWFKEVYSPPVWDEGEPDFSVFRRPVVELVHG